MTPRELKNSILQLAIQGKLVEQRLEEGTALDLYREIQAEKQRLIKAGKIKKEKPLPEISDDEKPFDIPESWRWVRVGDCGSWSAGATPSRTNLEYYGGNVPWLKTGDLNDGYISKVSEYITEKALNETSVRLNPVGSVLMAMYGATIGKLGILGIESTTNQACCACITYNGVYNKYLFYFLLAWRREFIKMGEGGAQPNISREKIVGTVFPLPPLTEQKRIVSKIEELMPLVDRYAEAWNRLETLNKRFPDDLKKSLLQLAIQGKLVPQFPDEGTGDELYREIQVEKQRLIKAGKIKAEKPLPEIAEDEKPFEIPESWKWVRLNNICSLIGDIDHNMPKSVAKEEGVAFLSAKDLLDDDTLNFSENIKYISWTDFERLSKKACPQRNDIIYSRIGAALGKARTVETDERFLVSYSCCVIRPLYIYPKYLRYYLESPIILEHSIQARQSIGVPDLGMGEIKKYPIALPPLAEQKRIVARLEELLGVCEKLK